MYRIVHYHHEGVPNSHTFTSLKDSYDTAARETKINRNFFPLISIVVRRRNTSHFSSTYASIVSLQKARIEMGAIPLADTVGARPFQGREKLRLAWKKLHHPLDYEKEMNESKKRQIEVGKPKSGSDPQGVSGVIHQEVLEDTGMEKIAITSVQIAEKTGKLHKNVMRDIKIMLKKLGFNELKSEPTSGSPNIRDFEGTYTDGRNRKKPMYILPEREALILASGYSVKLRASIIDELERLKREARQPAIPNFSDPAAAARAYAGVAVESAEMALKYATALEDSKSKAKALVEKDKLLAEKSEELVTVLKTSVEAGDSSVAEFAKTLGIVGFGKIKCLQWLQDHKFLMKNNEPYQRWVNKNWFRHKPHKEGVKTRARFQPMLTPLGRVKLGTLIRRELVKPVLFDAREVANG